MKFYIGLFLTITLLNGCNKLSVEEQIKQAKHAFDNNNFSEATVLLKNTLKNTPENLNARVLLAKAYTKQGLFLNAEKEWKKTIDAHIDLNTVLLPYFHTLHGLSDPVQIIDFWNKNQESINVATKASTGYIVAIAYMRLNELDESKTMLTHGIEWAKASNNQEAEVTNNALLKATTLQDTNQRMDNLTLACGKYPSNWIMCYIAANANFTNKNYSDSIAILETITKQLPYYYQASILLADSYVKNNNIEKAEQRLNALLRKFPKQAYINQLKAVLSAQQNKFELAKHHIDITISRGFSSPETSLIAALINYQLDNYEQTLGHLHNLKSSYPDNIFVKKLIVSSQIKLGNTNSAYRELNSIELTESNTQMFAAAGLELLKSGDTINSNKLINKLDTTQISDFNLLGQVGIAKLTNGNNEGIKDIELLLGRVLENDNVNNINQTKHLLISSLIATNQLSKAEEHINTWITENVDDAENYTLQASVLLQSKPQQINKAKHSYEKALELDPHNLIANQYFAYQAMLAKKYSLAIKHYNNALITSPDNLKSLKGIYLAYKYQDQESKGLNIIELQLKDHDSNEKHRLLLAQLYLTAEKHKKAIALLTNKTFTSTKLSNVQSLILADSYLALKDFDNAIIKYSDMLKSQGLDINILLKQLYAYEKSDRLPEAIQTLEDLYKEYPDNLKIGALLANYNSITNKASYSLAFVNSLSSEQQNNTFIKGIKGKALYNKTRYQDALPLLIQNYDVTQKAQIAAYIFTSYIKLDKSDNALGFMKAHLQKYPNDLVNRLFYTEELIKHDIDLAINEYKVILEIDKNNLYSLNNLAWYLYEQGKLEEAYNYAKRAKELAPSNVDILDTYNKVKSALDAK